MFGSRLLQARAWMRTCLQQNTQHLLRVRPLWLLGVGAGVCAPMACTALADGHARKQPLPVPGAEEPTVTTQQPDTDTVREVHSQTRLPRTLAFLGHDGRQYPLALVGTGMRCMMAMCWLPAARAYSMGFYIDIDAYRAHVSSGSHVLQYQAQVPDPLDTELQSHLLSATLPVTRGMHLVYVQDQSVDHIAKGYEKLLVRRKDKQQVYAAHKQPVEADSEDQKRLFADIRALATAIRGCSTFKVGDRMSWTWAPSNHLILTVNDQLVFQTQNPLLCWALFDIYLGHSALSLEARDRFLEGLVLHTRN